MKARRAAQEGLTVAMTQAQRRLQRFLAAATAISTQPERVRMVGAMEGQAFLPRSLLGATGVSIWPQELRMELAKGFLTPVKVELSGLA